MKVLLLGTGAMGAKAAEIVTGFDEIAQLTAADISIGSAQACAARCNRAHPGKAQAMQPDATDPAALRSAMQAHDAVLNLAGPFFRFAVPVLKAAIDTRTAYLDICDDPEPTLDMLALDAEARAAGTLAIIGMGASPGASNLTAVMAHDALDETEEILTAWSAESDIDIETEGRSSDGRPSAAIIHWMEQLTGEVKVWREGALALVKPMQPMRVDYSGIGTRTLWTVGHPEPITLPRTFPGIRRSDNLMVLGRLDALAIRKIAGGVDKGAASVEEAAQTLLDAMIAGRHSLWQRGLARLAALFNGPRLPAIFALAKGRKDGHPALAAATLRAVPEGGMAGATSTPLAIVLRMLARGRISGTGVRAPEAAVDPRLFFEEFSPYCTGTRFDRQFHPGADLVMLTKKFLR